MGGSLFIQSQTFKVYPSTASACLSEPFEKAFLQANCLNLGEPKLNPSLLCFLCLGLLIRAWKLQFSSQLVRVHTDHLLM